MSDVTQILSQIEDGDGQAAEKLLPLVYDELRKLAAEKMAHEKPGRRSKPRPWSTRRISGWWTSTEQRLGEPPPFLRSPRPRPCGGFLIENARRKGRPRHGG